MLDKQRVRPILLAGAIAGFGGLALIGGAQPAAAQYNPYCSYPNYDPYYCQVYGSYAYDYPSYDYGYDYPYGGGLAFGFGGGRSEEHTSELQSRVDLVCRLLLEKKKKQRNNLI